ncbi:MAG: DUF3095 family protein [Longimicrobiales bacterium]
MTTRQSRAFYANLPVRTVPVGELLGTPAHFTPVPADWHVILTDIKGSTDAFRAGRQEAVNLVAAGSIIAVLNLAKSAGLQIPFFFGGDGATLLTPSDLVDKALGALHAHQDNARRSLQLELRVGSVPVSALMQDGHEIRIARVRFTDLFSIPVVLGTGLSAAEDILKGESSDTAPDAQLDDALDLTGMECRWDRIRPGGSSREVVSLLVTTVGNAPQGSTYQRVIEHAERIYGPPAVRNPVSAPELHLTAKKLGLETRTKHGGGSVVNLIKQWLYVQIGRFLWVRGRRGQAYIRALTELTDTLVIDGRINTVIAGLPEQRHRLTKRLADMEQEGLIAFGMFVSRESVMSCYVEDRDAKHVHFVDGSDGGYTLASRMLKAKLTGPA